MWVPKIGKTINFDGVNWIVLDVGSQKFEHNFQKGVFSIINLNEMDCILVIIKNQAFNIVVDPTIPSVKVNNKELVNRYGNPGTYALLEYDVSIN